MPSETSHPAASRRRIVLLVGAAVLLLIGVAYSLGRSQADRTVHDRPLLVTTEDSAMQRYQCSMHPEIISTDPDARCPKCGMALAPMRSEAAPAAVDRTSTVLPLGAQAMERLSIETALVERRAIDAEVRFVGRLMVDERRVFDVTARSDSYIETLHANYQWMPLGKGEPLAELYSPDVTAAARELLVIHGAAGERSNAAATAAARAKLSRLGVSDEQVQAILDTGEAPRTFTVRSPTDGVLSTMGGHAGHWLAEGEHLAEVTDLSQLWLELEAYESDLPWLRTGQAAQFTVTSHPGETFTGTVAFIGPIVNQRTRTVSVRLDIPNEGHRLKPGMFARGVVHAAATDPAHAAEGHAEPPLLIPAAAPLLTGERAMVYVQQPDAERPTFEGRQVVLGPKVGDHYIVREGLAAGERVVTRGAFMLDSELQIRGRPSMMSPDGSNASAGGGGHQH